MSSTWFKSLSKAAQIDYLSKHPYSKLGKNSSKQTKLKAKIKNIASTTVRYKEGPNANLLKRLKKELKK